MKVLLSAFLAMIFVYPIACQNIKSGKQKVSSSFEKRIDAIFEQYDSLDSPGVAVAVTKNGETVFLKGYGAANLEHKIPINPKTTKFNIASTSKQVTVFAVLLLAEQKKLSMDDDVRKHIPELHDFGQKITLRHLAHHTSGIRSELQILAMAGWSPGDVMSRQNVLDAIYRQKELNFKTGEESSYSNSGYTLLSEVVERVSGQTFADFARENIFEPLGMNQTSFLSNHQSIFENMAYTYGGNQNSRYKINANFGYSGSTGIFTTASDFTKWALNFKNPKVGSKKVIEKMNTLGKLNNGEGSGFAMGQFIEEYRGLKHIQHGGASGGYISYLGRFPDQDVNIILMGNSSSINARRTSLQVADIFLEKYFKENSRSNTSTKAVNLSIEDLNKYVGTYWNNDDRAIRILINDNTLVFSGRMNVPLIPLSKTKFQMQGVGSDVRLHFKENSKGKYRFSETVNGREVNKYESYKPATYRTKDLEKYVGKYFSGELDTFYDVSIHNGNLIVSHLRFNDVTLSSINLDNFTSNSWRFSTLKFERDSSDKINGFRISSMRVKNVFFKKISVSK